MPHIRATQGRYETYRHALQKARKEGFAGEHAYRPALKRLVESFDPKAEATNEPKKQLCGAPDFIVSHKQLSIGYIETKDIGMSLDQALKTEQLGRYLGQPNLVLTDYLEFRWFVAGVHRQSAVLGGLDRDGEIYLQNEGIEAFESLMMGFLAAEMPVVSGAKELAVLMANSAQTIKRMICEALKSSVKSTRLREQLEGFKQVLLFDLNEERFADMYAQTISYGLFAARCNADQNITRHSAAHFVPKTNPFLRKLFNEIAGADLDDEPHVWAVDDLINLLNRTEIESVWKSRPHTDPIFHFYETFLEQYSPEERTQRGVFYTPQPIVNYIVRSVDQILKTRFELPAGLAESGKTKVPMREAFDESPSGKSKTRRSKQKVVRSQQLGLLEKEVHRVLILDPAAGTGTFLHSVIEQIYQYHKDRGQEGEWSSYVAEHLLPRIFGFELLMAPYAVAHMKLALQLKRTGYSLESRERVGIYLTNTLQAAQSASDLALVPLFAKEIADEANAATRIKRDLPIMVILGNPPYANFGMLNKSPWILDLLQDYKIGLKEKKLNLDDDFIKFIRFAQWRIEQSGSGVLAFITNNTYLDSITRRRMRESLLSSFTHIYVLDLHGSSKKEEVSPDGSKDENVFDIRQGVAIGIFVKEPESQSKCFTVHHADLWGTRESKYNYLNENQIQTTAWKLVEPESPYFFFVPKRFDYAAEYDKFPSVYDDIFPEHNAGIQTKRDGVVYQFTRAELDAVLKDFREMEPMALSEKYDLPPDGRDWRIEWAKTDIRKGSGRIISVVYRPFDHRWTLYTGKTKGFMAYPRAPLMRQALQPNLLLISVRNARKGNCDNYFVASSPVDKDSVSPFDNATFFPLYIYAEPGATELFGDEKPERKPNLSKKIIAQLESLLPLRFIADGKGDLKKTFGPEDVFGYIYGVLYSPTFRKRYAESLVLDFPRIPLTDNIETFRSLTALGSQLIAIHLLKTPTLMIQTKYPIAGSDVIANGFPKYFLPNTEDLRGEGVHRGRIYVNAGDGDLQKSQFFEGVTPEMWDFTIGGYKIGEKWLKERRSRKLTNEDIKHYQKVLAAAAETLHLSARIDEQVHVLTIDLSAKRPESARSEGAESETALRQ